MSLQVILTYFQIKHCYRFSKKGNFATKTLQPGGPGLNIQRDYIVEIQLSEALGPIWRFYENFSRNLREMPETNNNNL